MEQRITDLEQIFREAQQSDLSVSVGTSVSCLNSAIVRLLEDSKMGFAKSLEKFSIPEIINIICNRLSLDLGALLLLNALPQEEKDAFKERVENAYREFSTAIVEKGGKA